MALSETILKIGTLFGAADCSCQKAERLVSQMKVNLRKAARRANLPDEYVELLSEVYEDLVRRVGDHWPMVKKLAHFPEAHPLGGQGDRTNP